MQAMAGQSVEKCRDRSVRIGATPRRTSPRKAAVQEAFPSTTRRGVLLLAQLRRCPDRRGERARERLLDRLAANVIAKEYVMPSVTVTDGAGCVVRRITADELKGRDTPLTWVKNGSRGRGRQPILTPEQVEQVKARKLAGERVPDLAAAFGVSTAVVWKVTKGLGRTSKPRVTLTPQQHAEVVRRVQAGEPQRAVAKYFNVSPGCVYNLLRRQCESSR